jgi:photosystem II PsbU protein
MQCRPRRVSFTLALSSAAAALLPGSSWALTSEPQEYEIVAGQSVRTDKVDVNNSPVTDYMQFPGLYPTIAGKVGSSGPYASVKEFLDCL